MDTHHVFSSGSGHATSGLPMPLDGEVIPPGFRRADKPRDEPRTPAARRLGMPVGPMFIAAVAAALLGLGTAGGYFVWDRSRIPDATASALNQLQRDVGTLTSGVDTLKGNADGVRQDEAVRALKRSVDSLKAELDQARGTNAAALAQLSSRFERMDHDPSGKLAEIASRIDKLDRDPTPKLNEITARLDRIERQVSSPVPTGSIAAAPRPAAAAPIQQVAQPADKPPSKASIGNWIVRDVYDGIALVEARGGSIREVTPGEMLPGAGEVRSIERRGRAWIVVTSRGIIDDSTW